MHRRHLRHLRRLRTAWYLFGLTLLLARCSAGPTDPILPPSFDSHPLALTVDCDTADDVGAAIDLLEETEVLNHGRATALRTRLVQAMRHDAAGRSALAAAAYQQLVDQVVAWVAAGALDEADVANLLACTQDVLDGADTEPDPDPDPDPDPEPDPDPVMPVIDGVKSANEWDAATALAVFSGGTFYYTNDDTHLYIALEMVDATAQAADGFRIRFDDTQDGVPTVGDNEIRLRMDSYFDLFRSAFSWGAVDPTQNGMGEAGSSAGVNFFEVSFPLNSGDTNDFAASAGGPLRFCVQYLNNGVGVDTATYPRVAAFDNCILDSDQTNYATLTTSP